MAVLVTTSVNLLMVQLALRNYLFFKAGLAVKKKKERKKPSLAFILAEEVLRIGVTLFL